MYWTNSIFFSCHLTCCFSTHHFSFCERFWQFCFIFLWLSYVLWNMKSACFKILWFGIIYLKVSESRPQELSSQGKKNNFVCCGIAHLIELILPVWASLVAQCKEYACQAGDTGSIPGMGRSSGEGNGNPLCYSCLGHFMDRGAWQAVVYGVAKSRTWLSHKLPLFSLQTTSEGRCVHAG